MVMKTAYNATWSSNADSRWFQIQESDISGNFSKMCFKALKRIGLLNNYNTPVKSHFRNSEIKLPLKCQKEYLAELLVRKQPPKYYGHRYSYGNHQELVKAKYFTDDSQLLIKPLQVNSFAREISNISDAQSNRIWELLSKERYILIDQENYDSATAIGKPKKSLVRSKELYQDLVKLNRNYGYYSEPIGRLIIEAIGKQEAISLSQFENVFLQWEGLDQSSPLPEVNLNKKIAKEMGKMLQENNYLPTNSTNLLGGLDQKFTKLLSDFSEFVPKIVKVLSNHFIYGIGENAFDVESFKIDANGNHNLFYTGFQRYSLSYLNYSNMIDHVKLHDQKFAVEHDEQGNVIKALHKGIELIEYHPVSQRTTLIKLLDGRSLRFYYDAKGERILKRVFDKNGKINLETSYLRDEEGKVLVDQKIEYLPEGNQKTVTAYVYGSRGLLAFFRNNRFYSVTLDHAGSVRLIIENGGVVAAYDYLPYGELMRSFGNDPQAHIVYRYTGQEFDEETGLYNYHARLYDPSIGRFYQPDPKAQYFSPYKYAGNSPISAVDPNGEFAILLTCIIVGAIVGAYLGGAAANNRWNPIDWDLKDAGTWIGIGMGGVAGALLPIGFVGSVGVLGGVAAGLVGTAYAGYAGVAATTAFGIVGAYFVSGAANNEWNPIEWQWSRPKTWNGLFSGFAIGSNLPGAIGNAHVFASGSNLLTTISKVVKIQRDVAGMIFLGVTYTTGGVVAYAYGMRANKWEVAFWEWNWTKPGTYAGLLSGFNSGIGFPVTLGKKGRALYKLARWKHYRGSYSLVMENPSKFFRLKMILTNPRNPMHDEVATDLMDDYIKIPTSERLDILQYNLASLSSYESVLNDAFLAKDMMVILKSVRSLHSMDFSNPSPLNLRMKRSISMHINQMNKTTIIVENHRKIQDVEYQVSSGASGKLAKFWTTNWIKNVQVAVTSLLPTSWITSAKDEQFSSKSSYEEQQQFAENLTVLEMGDKWINSTDINGLLAMGVLIARKLTGYKPKNIFKSRDYQESHVVYDIQSMALLEIYQDVLLQSIENANTLLIISGILEDSKLFNRTIKLIRENLMLGKLITIPNTLNQYYSKIIGKSAPKIHQEEVDQVLDKMADNIPILQEKFVEYEQKLVFSDKISNEMYSSSTDNAQQLIENIPLLQQPFDEKITNTSNFYLGN